MKTVLTTAVGLSLSVGSMLGDALKTTDLPRCAVGATITVAGSHSLNFYAKDHDFLRQHSNNQPFIIGDDFNGDIFHHLKKHDLHGDFDPKTNKSIFINNRSSLILLCFDNPTGPEFREAMDKLESNKDEFHIGGKYGGLLKDLCYDEDKLQQQWNPQIQEWEWIDPVMLNVHVILNAEVLNKVEPQNNVDELVMNSFHSAFKTKGQSKFFDWEVPTAWLKDTNTWVMNAANHGECTHQEYGTEYPGYFADKRMGNDDGAWQYATKQVNNTTHKDHYFIFKGKEKLLKNKLNGEKVKLKIYVKSFSKVTYDDVLLNVACLLIVDAN